MRRIVIKSTKPRELWKVSMYQWCKLDIDIERAQWIRARTERGKSSHENNMITRHNISHIPHYMLVAEKSNFSDWKSMKCLINFLHGRSWIIVWPSWTNGPPAWNQKRRNLILTSLTTCHVWKIYSCSLFSRFYMFCVCYRWELRAFFLNCLTLPLGWVQLLSNGWQWYGSWKLNRKFMSSSI